MLHKNEFGDNLKNKSINQLQEQFLATTKKTILLITTYDCSLIVSILYLKLTGTVPFHKPKIFSFRRTSEIKGTIRVLWAAVRLGKKLILKVGCVSWFDQAKIDIFITSKSAHSEDEFWQDLTVGTKSLNMLHLRTRQ